MKCRRCNCDVRRREELLEDFPGTLTMKGRGLCSRCHRECTADGSLEEWEPLEGASGPETWTVLPCAGGCGQKVRRSRLKPQDYPGTVLDQGGRRCKPCRAEQFHNGRTVVDRPVDELKAERDRLNREALKAWHIKKENLARMARRTNRKLAR